MDAPITFCRASLQDAPLLGWLHSETWRQAYQGIVPEAYLAAFTPEKRAAAFTRFLREAENEHYLLYHGENAIGLLALGGALEEALRSKGHGEVISLYLLPDCCGKAFGKAAMDFAVQRLRTLGYDSVVLNVLSENMRARRFYERYGFVRDGKEEPITLGKTLMEMRYRMHLCP